MCYGLEEVPDGDFVCQTCQVFDDRNKLVPCALCTLKGGIMRPTTLKTREKHHQANQRENQGQHKSSKLSNSVTLPAVISSYIKKEMDYQLKCAQLRMKGDLAEDFFQTYYQWVHLSCVFWMPELSLPFKAPIKLCKQSDSRARLNCIIC